MKRKSKLKEYFTDILKLKTSPHEIALGFAVGSFIAILPTPGFSIFIGMLIVFLYKKINKISLFFALAFWNPFVLIPIYSAAFAIGDYLFSSMPVVTYDMTAFNQVLHFSRRFIVGSLILATTISTISYVLIRVVLSRFKK